MRQAEELSRGVGHEKIVKCERALKGAHEGCRGDLGKGELGEREARVIQCSESFVNCQKDRLSLASIAEANVEWSRINLNPRWKINLYILLVLHLPIEGMVLVVKGQTSAMTAMHLTGALQ